MELFTGDEARVFVDDFYSPVLFSHWYGRADVLMCEQFARWHDAQIVRALQRRQTLVLISDARHARRPTPDVRRFFTEWSQTQPPVRREATIGAVAVIDSRFMRRAMTMIGWLSPVVRRVATVATIPEAITYGLRMLDSEGVERPPKLDPDSYASPGSDEALARGA